MACRYVIEHGDVEAAMEAAIGARICELPLTAERVWRAMRGGQGR